MEKDLKIYLAPLSGVTDLSFRLISREFGAKLCFFEMIDSNAITRAHPGTMRLLKTTKDDRPIAAQLLGSDPSVMLDAAQKLTDLADMALLDVNSACPAKKVIRKKAGAHLLKDSKRLGKIVKKLSSSLRIPVTVKLRTGYSKIEPEEIVKTAKICEAAGASIVFIHGRTVSQGYSGRVDYGSIKAVKDALKIPVFGSGDITGPLMAKKMLDETGCDGILAARGAMGNPWIFDDIRDYFKSGKVIGGRKLEVKKKVLKKHLTYVERYKDIGERNKIGFMGKLVMWYLKGLPNSSRIRERICAVRSYGEFGDLIDGISD